ncbi:MAG: ABC transporter permease [Beduini sp.]|uniref:ABC transporter permease n=1 Tax=Beduini sp. TaxID=1922300 RepID=UPI0039A0FD9F
MKIAGYKIKALFIKDIKNLFRNPNVAFMLLLPIAFAFLYTHIMEMPDEAGMYVFNLCTILNMGVVPISIVAMSIAEEKEKNTLRTLMLSNVSAVEFMTAKLVLGIVMFLGVNVLVYFICGVDIALFPWTMFVIFVTSLSALMFGAVIGLISKDQMATGYYSTPVMLLFMAPIFGMMSESISKVTQFIPTQSMMWLQSIESAGDLMTGKGLFSIAVIAAWMIISLVVFKFVYKKNSLDN